ncbi:MAG: NUDIX hydrolase [Deinococcota bacterium]|nr:NUDIX hydrolase [Deinococcota bacterium]
MDYIKEIRQLVGSRPIIFPGAALLILDAQDRLLLQRRRDSGSWGLISGFMDPGETLEDTARREALEETGLIIGALSLLNVFSGPSLFWKFPNGHEVYNVTAAYITRDFEGTLRADGIEGIEVRFFELDALPEDISPPIKPVLEYFMKKTQFALEHNKQKQLEAEAAKLDNAEETAV